ncbi:MAG: hypothetical protein ACK47B_10565 [Armatimonadota bacterium]
MAQVLCSEQVQERLSALSDEVREAVELRLGYLEEMPRMYAVSTDDRFPGCRTFWVDPCYRVFYMVAAVGDDVYVMALVQEEIDQPDEE